MGRGNWRRKGHYQHNINNNKNIETMPETPHRVKKILYFGDSFILWILTDDAGCARVCGVLPLQNTKDHVHRSRTIEIGRQKQRAVYAYQYSTYYWICERKCVHQRTSRVSTQAINRHGNDSNNTVMTIRGIRTTVTQLQYSNNYIHNLE